MKNAHKWKWGERSYVHLNILIISFLAKALTFIKFESYN